MFAVLTRVYVKVPAANGQLVFLCGGDRELFDVAAQDLDLMGKVTRKKNHLLQVSCGVVVGCFGKENWLFDVYLLMVMRNPRPRIWLVSFLFKKKLGVWEVQNVV